MRLRSLLISGVALLAASGLALAAGNWSTLPIVGGSSFCASFVTTFTGQSCGQTVPAGPPALTGVEIIPGDTQLTGGAPPQTVGIPSPLLGSINAKENRIIGGDFATNLWQRGTTPVSGATPSTTVIGADHWAVYSSTNTVTVIKETGATDAIPSLGLNASMRVSRPSSTTTTAICTGQVLDTQAASALIGNNGVFSFYALASSTFASVSNGSLSVTVAYYTATDSATPLTNTDAFMKGSIGGYTAAIGGLSNGTTGTVASGVATIPISTTWTRYAVWAPIPAANSSGTQVTGVGVTLCYTPTSGTGASTEYFEVEGAQLQAMPSLAANSLPNGVTSPTGFERRAPAVEAALQQYYTQSGGLGKEKNGAFYQAGICAATGNANFQVNFPIPMRVAPTAATSTLTAGGYSIQTAVAQTAIGTMTFVSGSTSVNGVTLNSTAACTATLPYAIVGTNTTGLLLFSAEP